MGCSIVVFVCDDKTFVFHLNTSDDAEPDGHGWTLLQKLKRGFERGLADVALVNAIQNSFFQEDGETITDLTKVFQEDSLESLVEHFEKNPNVSHLYAFNLCDATDYNGVQTIFSNAYLKPNAIFEGYVVLRSDQFEKLITRWYTKYRHLWRYDSPIDDLKNIVHKM